MGEGRPELHLHAGQQPRLPGVSDAPGPAGEGPGHGTPDLGPGQEAQPDQRGQRQSEELAQHVGQALHGVRGGQVLID